MTFDKAFAKTSLVAAVLAVMVAGIASLSHHGIDSRVKLGSKIRSESMRALFSPADDLEIRDIQALDSAEHSIDVAMYSFTDLKIESALENAARRGVKIRIYRDSLQFADEQARASRRGVPSVIDQLRNLPGIEIKVKKGGRSMHLKSYCVDGMLLRTGSANWSTQGEIEQDNDVYFVPDVQLIKRFQEEFVSLWDEEDNSSR